MHVRIRSTWMLLASALATLGTSPHNCLEANQRYWVHTLYLALLALRRLVPSLPSSLQPPIPSITNTTHTDSPSPHLAATAHQQQRPRPRQRRHVLRTVQSHRSPVAGLRSEPLPVRTRHSTVRASAHVLALSHKLRSSAPVPQGTPSQQLSGSTNEHRAYQFPFHCLMRLCH